MHELGIVTHVMKTIEEIAPERGIVKVGSVTLEVGEVSGILTDQFVDCWNYFRKKRPLFTEAELHLVTTPAVTYCTSCHRTYPTVQFGKICPYCQSPETYLVKGNEVIIQQIEAETSRTPAATDKQPDAPDKQPDAPATPAAPAEDAT